MAIHMDNFILSLLMQKAFRLKKKSFRTSHVSTEKKYENLLNLRINEHLLIGSAGGLLSV